jgi:carbamoyl-phosphate synthase large subunit
MEQVRVLVTGAGSGVGQGIIKSLRISNLPVTLISTDISPLNSALYRADEAFLIPKVESEGALERIIDLINKHHIDVVLIGSEFDLMFFAQHKEIIHKETGALVIVSPPETVAIADDKWLTSEFLRENSLPYAESFVSESLDVVLDKAVEWGFPVILKARTGTSSRGVYLIHKKDELINLWGEINSPMLQKVIDIPSSELNTEYTCSIFKTARGTILGPFHARRTLRGGTSWHIEVKDFPEQTPLLMDIGRKIPFEGSLNIQLMVGDSGGVPFEFNARFSGTTAVRANFGFNEPAMALQSYFYNEEPSSLNITSGVAMRYHEEVFIPDVSVEDLHLGNVKGHVRQWF